MRILKRLVSSLTGLARSANAVYTRYADDLLSSEDEEFARSIDRFTTTVAVIAAEENFRVNCHKTCVMKRSVRQEAVGLILNQTLNTRRDEFDRLKAILHQCVMRAPEAANAGQHANFFAHLYGRIQRFVQKNDTRRAKPVRLFKNISVSAA